MLFLLYFKKIQLNTDILISSLCSNRTFISTNKLYSRSAEFRKRKLTTQKTWQKPTRQTLPKYHGNDIPSGNFSVDKFKSNNTTNVMRQQKPTNKKILKPSTPVTKKTRGYIPAKFKLLPIQSDVKLHKIQHQTIPQITTDNSSIKQKTSRQEQLELLNLK